MKTHITLTACSLLFTLHSTAQQHQLESPVAKNDIIRTNNTTTRIVTTHKKLNGPKAKNAQPW